MNSDLVDAIEEAIELLEGYVDVRDGVEGRPLPNDAMRAVQLLQGVVDKVKRRGVGLLLGGMPCESWECGSSK
jgi:hypothetical protein